MPKNKFKSKLEPCCEQIAVRDPKERIPTSSRRRRPCVPKQMLFGLRYSYLLVDKTISNRTEALQLLGCARRDVDIVTRWLSDRWLRKRGCPKGGYGLVLVPIVDIDAHHKTGLRLAGQSRTQTLPKITNYRK